MGLLGKLFGGKKQDSAATAQTTSVECPHAVLVPRWESVQDMGHEDKITRFMCEACQQEFAPEVAAQLRLTVNERVDSSVTNPQDGAFQKRD